MLKILKVVPKYSELDNSLIWYNLHYWREWVNFIQTKFYTVAEAKTLFSVNTLDDAMKLVGREILLKLELKK